MQVKCWHPFFYLIAAYVLIRFMLARLNVSWIQVLCFVTDLTGLFTFGQENLGLEQTSPQDIPWSKEPNDGLCSYHVNLCIVYELPLCVSTFILLSNAIQM